MVTETVGGGVRTVSGKSYTLQKAQPTMENSIHCGKKIYTLWKVLHIIESPTRCGNPCIHEKTL